MTKELMLYKQREFDFTDDNAATKAAPLGTEMPPPRDESAAKAALPAPEHCDGQEMSSDSDSANAALGHDLTKEGRLPSATPAVTPSQVLAFLQASPGREFTTGELREAFGIRRFDPANPLANPVHSALRTLCDSGQIHAITPSWGEPRVSVLLLPRTSDQLTLHHCPGKLEGPELKRLFKVHKTSVKAFAARCNFTQKHVLDVLERGLDNQNAVRDWLEALLPKKGIQEPAHDKAPPGTTLSPYTFDDYKAFHRAFHEGSLSFASYKEHFERLLLSQESVRNELLSRFKAPALSQLASRMGAWDASRSTKSKNADSIVHRMLSSFVLDGSVKYSPMSGETYLEALTKKVRALTEGEYHRHFELLQEASMKEENALLDPQTFDDFRLAVHAKGEDGLTDEQLSRYDALHADMTRAKRAKDTPATVTKFQSENLNTVQFEMKEGFHDKRQCPLWIVQLSTRIERDAFNELNRKAKMLGGWFSSFKKSDAGFQFLDKDKAERFTSLLQGDADRSDVLASRQERKELTAAEYLHELAISLAKLADQTIERSMLSLQNTVRRSEMQAGIRGRAYADRAMSTTLHSLAEALSRGEANYLSGIRHRTQLAALDTVLYLAKWNRTRTLAKAQGSSSYEHAERIRHLESEPIDLATVRYAKYPYPYLYKQHLQDLVTHCRNKRGATNAAVKMAKRLAGETDDYVTFKAEHDVAFLIDFIDRAKAADIDVTRAATSLEQYKRLTRAGITDIHELRAALREYLPHRAATRGDDPVLTAERELIGNKIPGFFPTPRPIIDQMLEVLAIEPHHSVLEPSCGKGDILDALIQEHQGISLHAIECNHTLSDVLSAKGHEVSFMDFLEHDGEYDRIIMNPPFEDGQDIDHVRHAYSLLLPGGRLVSVMSEGPFFRSDKKSTAFREWLNELGAHTEQLPEDAFNGHDAFRQTGVRTRLAIIEKR